MAESRLFFWLFFLLQLALSEFSVVGHEPVQASVGDDVILSCHLDPPYDVTKLTVEWTWNGVNVHVYRHRRDDDDLQDEHFRGRTSLFHHKLVKGDISLKLTNVTEDDSGLYICYVPKLKSQVKRENVLLSIFRHKPVQVTAGDDVILPCHLDPPFDVTDLTVEWIRDDTTVHVYRDRRDDGDLQDEQFRGRTSLFHHELVKGNISLKLTNVHEDDSGLYICYVPRLQSQVKRENVLLSVYPQKDPEGRGGDNETPDDKKPIRDLQTSVIVSSILSPLLVLSAFGVLLFVNGIRRRGRQRRNREVH